MAVSWEVEVKCIMGVPPASLILRIWEPTGYYADLAGITTR